MFGTLQYLAPEQLEGRESDERTDIFACGAVIYEMVTGRKAFDGDSPASVIAAIMRHDPPSITAVQPAAPPALEHVVSTCLAKDPDDRWQNAGDLTRELKWIAALGSGQSDRASRRLGALRPAALWMAMAALLLLTTARARSRINSCGRRCPTPSVFRTSILLPEGCGFRTGAPRSAGSDGSRCRLTAGAWRLSRPIPTAIRCSGCGRSTRWPRCRSPAPTAPRRRSGRPIRA